MAKKMSRRKFLKLLAVGGISFAAGAVGGLTDGREPNRKRSAERESADEKEPP